MATDIANQLGTARQFNNRPDATYQGRYQGLQVPRVSSNAEHYYRLQQNFNQLAISLQNNFYKKNKEQEELGLKRATHMIQGMSSEDIQRLNLIDYAQTHGYEDVIDNPYFKAYAEKLKGQQLARIMKDKYDQEYAMTPLASMEEEKARYDKFRTDFAKEVYKGAARPENAYAFDEGFNESNLLNQNKLAHEFLQKKHNEDMVSTVAEVQSKLGDLMVQAPQILSENGLMTKKLQEIMNINKLAGVDPKTRYALIEQWTTQMVAGGHLDETRLEQMADSVVLHTVDGKDIKIKDVLNMAEFKEATAKMHTFFIDEERERRIKNQIENFTPEEASVYYSKAQKETPFEAKNLREDYERVIRGIKQKEQAELERQRFNLQLEAMKSQHQTLDNNIYSLLHQYAETGYPNVNDPNHEGLSTTLRNLGYKATDVVPIWGQVTRELIEQGKVTEAYRLLTVPLQGIDQARKDLGNSFLNDLDLMSLDENGNAIIPDQAQKTLNMLLFQPHMIGRTFGEDVSRKAMLLSGLYQAYNGDMNRVGGAFVKVNRASQEDRTNTRNQIEEKIRLSGLTVNLPDWQFLGTGQMNTRNTSTTAAGARLINKVITDVAMAKMLGDGASVESALNQAKRVVEQNFAFYHDALFPKGLYAGAVTPNVDELSNYKNAYYFQKALEMKIYETDNTNPSDVSIYYNSSNDSFVFKSLHTNSQLTLHTKDIHAYAKKLSTGTQVPPPNIDNIRTYHNAVESGTKVDLDTLNAQRKAKQDKMPLMFREYKLN